MMRACGFALLFACVPALADPVETLPGTRPLTEDGDLSKAMLDGLHRFAERKIDESVEARAKLWNRDPSSREAYEKSIQANRESFRKIIGVVDPRLPVTMERFGDDDAPALVAEGDTFRAYQVRWPVLEGVHGEGLLLEPTGRACGATSSPCPTRTRRRSRSRASPRRRGRIAVRPAAGGERISRRGPDPRQPRDRRSPGIPRIAMTNQPHREWIYRQAYQMGRHVIGYEVQKVLAAVDWIEKQAGPDAKVGVAGYGEGGLIAFYAAAADPRIDAALVSGYFGPRQRVWAEPIYRNVWGLLHEFGDAEIATLIAPRGLVVEHSEGPRVDRPARRAEGPARRGRGGRARDAGAGRRPRRVAADRRPPARRTSRSVSSSTATATRCATSSAARPCGHSPGCSASRRRWSCPEAVADRPADGASIPTNASSGRSRSWRITSSTCSASADATRNAFFLNQTTLIRTLAPRGERFRMFRVKEQSAEVFAREVGPFREVFAREVIGRIDDPVLPADSALAQDLRHARSGPATR